MIIENTLVLKRMKISDVFLEVPTFVYFNLVHKFPRNAGTTKKFRDFLYSWVHTLIFFYITVHLFYYRF